MIDAELLPFLVFFAIVGLLVLADRKRIEVHGPLLIRKTNRGKRFIVNTGQRFQRFWSITGNIAVVAGFIASFYTLYMLLVLLADSIVRVTPAAGVGLVLPSPTTVVGGGFIGVPLWYWIIAAIIMFVVHEGAHGIIGASQKMKIKKLGWILFTLLPIGAFVEPDEKDVTRKKPLKQLRFFAAGSFSNFILALLVAVVITPLVLNPLTVPAQGFQVFPQEGFPFAASEPLVVRTNNFSQGLNPKFFIRSINGRETADLVVQLDVEAAAPASSASTSAPIPLDLARCRAGFRRGLRTTRAGLGLALGLGSTAFSFGGVTLIGTSAVGAGVSGAGAGAGAASGSGAGSGAGAGTGAGTDGFCAATGATSTTGRGLGRTRATTTTTAIATARPPPMAAAAAILPAVQNGSSAGVSRAGPAGGPRGLRLSANTLFGGGRSGAGAGGTIGASDGSS